MLIGKILSFYERYKRVPQELWWCRSYQMVDKMDKRIAIDMICINKKTKEKKW